MVAIVLVMLVVLVVQVRGSKRRRRGRVWRRRIRADPVASHWNWQRDARRHVLRLSAVIPPGRLMIGRTECDAR